MIINIFSSYYEDLGIFLYLTPLISILCFAFVLFIKPNRTRHQLYLAVCFAGLGIGMAFSLWYDRYVGRDEILRSVNFITTSVTAVTVLFYFTSILYPDRLTRQYIVKHILAIVLFSVLLLVSDIISTESITGWSQTVSVPFLIRLIDCICVIMLEVYVGVVVFNLYTRQKKYIKNRRWILWSIALFILFAFCDLSWIVYSNPHLKAFVNIISMVLIFCIFILGYRFNVLMADKKDWEPKENSADPPAQLKNMLLEYFENEAPYLNPDLNLRQVASVLKTNTTYLSRLINGEFGMNFYTFVNNYRINYAISMIRNSEDRMTSDALYTASGFKSRSVFYKMFKEKTGYSPQDYIQRKEEFA